MWLDMPCAVCAPQVEIPPGGTVFTSIPSPYRFHVLRVLVNRVTDAGEFEPVLWPWPTPPTGWQRFRGWVRRRLRIRPKGVEVLLTVGDRRVEFDARDFHGHIDLGLVEPGGEIEIELRNHGAERSDFEVIKMSFEGRDLDEEERRARLQRDARATLDHLRDQLAPTWTARRTRDDG